MSVERRGTRGLTLLELLLVVFILSVVSLGAVALVDRQEDHIRLDETRSKLNQIRAAVVGPSSFDGVLAGYVADVGALPESIDDLVRSTGKPSPGMLTPSFGTTTLSGAQHRLPRGWRGPYLALPPSADPSTALFRDGWENGLRDDPDHGWVWDNGGLPDLAIASVGADGTLGPAGTGTGDEVGITIEGAAWRLDLDGWQVTARSLPTDGADFFAALLVPVWNPATAAWSWAHVDSEKADADDEGKAALVFDKDGDDDRYLAAGHYLVVLGQASGGTDGLYDAKESGATDPVYVSAHVRLLPKRDLPVVTLEVP